MPNPSDFIDSNQPSNRNQSQPVGNMNGVVRNSQNNSNPTNGSSSVSTASNSYPNPYATYGQTTTNQTYADNQEFDDPISVQPISDSYESIMNFERDLGHSFDATEAADEEYKNQYQNPTTPKININTSPNPALSNLNSNHNTQNYQNHNGSRPQATYQQSSPDTISNGGGRSNNYHTHFAPNLNTHSNPGSAKAQQSQNSSSGISMIFTKISNLIILVLLIGLIFASFFWSSPWALLVFWLAALVAFKFNSNFRWVVILISIAGILTKFQFHVIALGSLILVVLPALFLGFNPKLSTWSKYLAGLISLVMGLMVAVPMSIQGSLNYVINEYAKGELFTKVVDATYQTAGSPKLSATDVEADFKKQISGEISRLAAEQTSGKISQEDEIKLVKLCQQAPNFEALQESCDKANKDSINQTISTETSKQVDAQIQGLKDNLSRTPQIQFATNLLNQTATEQQAFISSPYYIPLVLFFIIYLIVGSVLAFISWPLGLLLDRITLS